jgi:uncharacterized protein (DUF58 family)
VKLRRALDWGKLAPLRLVARSVADGVYAGAHRSARRGTGIEFGGHREYVPGDDLRFVDRRALMRHERLLVREFETETDRTLRLIVDASASMGFRSSRAPGAKLAFAAVVAAALGRIALAGGDPVALDWIGGEAPRPMPASGGREAFERLLGALESVAPGGDTTRDGSLLDVALAPIARHARRGALVLLLSDLFDLPSDAPERFAALAARGRTLIVVQVLDPLEASFSLEGPVRLRSLEGDVLVETDAAAARQGYLAALEQLAERWNRRLVPRGGTLLPATTDSDPVSVVRAVLAAAEGRHR